MEGLRPRPELRHFQESEACPFSSPTLLPISVLMISIMKCQREDAASWWLSLNILSDWTLVEGSKCPVSVLGGSLIYSLLASIPILLPYYHSSISMLHSLVSLRSYIHGLISQEQVRLYPLIFFTPWHVPLPSRIFLHCSKSPTQQ